MWLYQQTDTAWGLLVSTFSIHLIYRTFWASENYIKIWLECDEWPGCRFFLCACVFFFGFLFFSWRGEETSLNKVSMRPSMWCLKFPPRPSVPPSLPPPCFLAPSFVWIYFLFVSFPLVHLCSLTSGTVCRGDVILNRSSFPDLQRGKRVMGLSQNSPLRLRSAPWAPPASFTCDALASHACRSDHQSQWMPWFSTGCRLWSPPAWMGASTLL